MMILIEKSASHNDPKCTVSIKSIVRTVNSHSMVSKKDFHNIFFL